MEILNSLKGKQDGSGQTGGQSQGGAQIIDGDQNTFMQEVVEASRQIPVLVDFWATWCGPCKTLTPTLEKVVRATGGRVKLVKIDIDKNRSLVQQLSQLGLPMQSVPTVAAFWQGQIADLFQGALPESEIRRFVDALLSMAGTAAPATDLLEEARTALAGGNADEAASLFGAVLKEDPDKGEAWGGLSRAMLAMGDEQQAETLLGRVPEALREHPEVAAARSAIAVAREGRESAGNRAALEARIAEDPDDLQARYDLAISLNAVGERDAAADALLEIIRRQRGWNEDAARQQLLKFFEAWGVEDPATVAARRRLSSLLFS